jgi:hypothetical protein
VYDIIKAELRFGLYRHATTEVEREVAGWVDEQYEDGLMCRLTASRRTIGYAEALRLQDLAEFAAARPGQKPGERFSEWAADEISVAMGWTRNMAHAQLHLAMTVTSRLPGTLTALSRGELDLRGAKALAEITDPLDAATAKAVEDAVLPRAAKQNTSELRRAARRAVLRLDPAGAQQRHEKRRQERRVELNPLEDAMAELTAILPAPDATAIYQRLNDFAQATPPDDGRTMDQRRADTFTDLLLGTPITITPDNGNGNGNEDTDSQAGNEDTNDQGTHSADDGSTSSGDATEDDQETSRSGAADSETTDGGISDQDADGEGGNADGQDAISSDSGASARNATNRDQGTTGGGTGRDGAIGSGGRSGRGGRTAGATTGATRTLVRVTVPIGTLMGIDDQPGDLAGYGPIPAGLARDIAAGGTWKRLLTDPVSGMLLDYGRTTYRPPVGLADFVRARDHACVFPGCSRPADACDIDHRKPHPEGPTSEDNLECLCKHHHRLKHEAGWTVEYHNGVHVWTTPDGHRYHRQPHPIAEPQPPPPAPAKPADEPPPF